MFIIQGPFSVAPCQLPNPNITICNFFIAVRQPNAAVGGCVNCHGRGSSASELHFAARLQENSCSAVTLHNVSTGLTHENARSAPIVYNRGGQQVWVKLHSSDSRRGSVSVRCLTITIHELVNPSLAWYDIIDTIHAKLAEGGR